MHSIRLRWIFLPFALAALAFTAFACGGSDSESSNPSTEAGSPGAAGAQTPAAKEVTVGFLYVGTIDDGGYNQAAYQGELAVAKIPGVKTIRAENVPETAEAERVMEQMIAQGATIIFPTSFGHLDPALNVAAKYPDVTFFHEGGLKSSENLGTFFGTIWQAEYLAGMAAGAATQSDKLGFVVAFPISQTLLNINAFQLGARSMNPNVTTTVVFTGNWCDPAKNAEATQSLVSQGIDVVTQHQDCPVPVIQAAENAGIMSVGYHVDDSKFAPKGWLTAAVWDWTKLFPQLVQAAIDGTYKPGVQRYFLSDGVVDLAPFGDMVPQDVRTMIEQKKTEMAADNPFLPFVGPVKDQNGEVQIAEGETPTIDYLESIDWLAEGVIGTIPN
jgi:basic membrane lipoprotein Med (substrate-binding protein (PBP1-ABC) superfamily)